jgi:two-component system OmpR family sensor kinase
VSLRTRLLLAVSTAALLALVVADVAIYRALRSYLYDRVDAELTSARRTVAAGIPNGLGNAADLIPGTFLQLRTADGTPVFTQRWSRFGDLQTPALPADLPGDDRPPGPGGITFFSTDAEQSGGPSFRVRVETLADGGVLIFATPLDSTEKTLHRLLAVEVLVTAGALIASVLLGASLVGLGLRPLARMEETADAIVGGDALDRRVPGETERTEVGRLARSLNTMLARLQVAFAERDATEAELRRSEQRLRRFVGDASHELRTPLAAISAYAELYERAGPEHEVDRPRMLAGIRSETARMGRLVEDLLLLARLDEGQRLEHVPVDLLAIADEAVEAATAVGPEWPVTLVASSQVEVVGDATRLRQVVDNLLANTRAHTPPGTRVTVHVSRAADRGVLEVDDTGPGLAPEDASRVFERFYRTDGSRSRRSGGTGLGLAIVAAIVEAHGGEVELRTAPGAGARFTVSIPLAPAPAALPVASATGDDAVSAGSCEDTQPVHSSGTGTGRSMSSNRTDLPPPSEQPEHRP